MYLPIPTHIYLYTWYSRTNTIKKCSMWTLRGSRWRRVSGGAKSATTSQFILNLVWFNTRWTMVAWLRLWFPSSTYTYTGTLLFIHISIHYNTYITYMYTLLPFLHIILHLFLYNNAARMFICWSHCKKAESTTSLRTPWLPTYFLSFFPSLLLL